MSKKRAAAICYRQEGDRIKFLLVITSGSRKKKEKKEERWTFPKGHVRGRECGTYAAAREAMEEAGAAGFIDPDPLGAYLYPEPASESDEPVIAYLLEVMCKSLPKEKWRNPTWFSGEEAKEKLGICRENKFAEAHERIIDAAMKRLRRK